MTALHTTLFEPLPPSWHWEIVGVTLFALGRYVEAAEAFARMSPLNFWNHAQLAACYGQLGDAEKAKEHLRAYMAEMPDASIRHYTQFGNHFKKPEDLEPVLEGLRKAGLPE